MSDIPWDLSEISQVLLSREYQKERLPKEQ
jgi:hypothetical protein